MPKEIDKKGFRPYVPHDVKIPELTITSIVIGILLAVIFGAANAYLGLRVGMTVSASIPAAVISMGVIRVLLKRDSILENNMVQTIGSAGESVAAGAIFTIPALFIWAKEQGLQAPSLFEITCIALLGGLLGVCFMIPLRHALLVKEHEKLPYPEGSACAEVLMAGEEGEGKSTIVFAGLGIAAIYKFLSEGLKLYPSELHTEVPRFRGGIGIDVLPALVGVGYICGFRISSYMFAGGVFGWLALIPLIALFGRDTVLFPGTDAIATMDSWTIWSSYVKYIGAGAVAMGGLISLVKTMPMIVSTFQKSMRDYARRDKSVAHQSTGEIRRTEKDLSIRFLMVAILVLILLVWLVPMIPVNLGGAVLIAVFGFIFATVSARLVGLVGSSNNPVSGMTIATLLIVTLLLKSSGQDGTVGMISAIAIGSIICIVSAIAGDTSQDLKTGYLLGATPLKQQIGEMIGVVASALTIGGVLYLLNAAWGYNTPNLPAPQATLMKMIVEGVMDGNLPWTLVIVGAAFAVGMELVRIPVLPFAVGLYLPIHLSAGILVGGVIRWFLERGKGGETRASNGILYCSGLIAGEGLVGILLAVFAIIPAGKANLLESITLSSSLTEGKTGIWFSIIAFLLLLLSLLYFAKNRLIEKEEG